jgi:hypothetical protein
MQALWDASPKYYDGKERRLICDVQIINGGMISEDIQLCKKLSEAGFQMYLDNKHTCEHGGKKKYTGDYRSKYATALVSQIMKDKI